MPIYYTDKGAFEAKYVGWNSPSFSSEPSASELKRRIDAMRKSIEQEQQDLLVIDAKVKEAIEAGEDITSALAVYRMVYEQSLKDVLMMLDLTINKKVT